MKRLAILFIATGLIAAPALAQQQQPRQPLPPQVSPTLHEKLFIDPRDKRALQPSNPCDPKRGRMVKEPDPGRGPIELDHRPLDPRDFNGRLCPAAPKI
jgi:hypothetical protein